MTETWVCTRDLVGWNGERLLAGMAAPVLDWPDDYVAALVAEEIIRLGAVSYEPPVAPGDVPQTDVVEELSAVSEAGLTAPGHSSETPAAETVVDTAGAAHRPQGHGQAT